MCLGRLAVLTLLLGAGACAAPVPAVASPTVLDTAPHAADAPHAAVGADGTLAVVCAAGDDILCCVAPAGGGPFASPVRVGAAGRLEHGLMRGPRVAVTPDALVVTAICGELLGGRDGELLAWRSEDRGATWQGPVAVSDALAAAREGLHALAAGPDGRLLAVWLDLRADRTEVWGSWSADGGAHWSANACLYRSPEGGVCECCPPAVTFAPDGGHATVLWRNLLGGNRDIYTLRVRFAPEAERTVEPAAGRAAGSAAATALEVGPAMQSGVGHWPLDACPMAGGGAALLRDGTALAFWRRGGELFTARAGEPEELLARGRETHAAPGPDGAHLLWTDSDGHVRTALWPATPGARAVAAAAHAGTGASATVPSAPPTSRNWGRGFNAALAGAADGLGPVFAVWETGAPAPDNLRHVLLVARAAESGR